MKYVNKLGGSFDNLAKRVLYSYIATNPKFIPIENIETNQESQKQMYEFLYEAINTIYEPPSIIGISDDPDAYYENRQMNNTNPSLIKSMKKIEKKFFGFLESLLKAGVYGERNENSLYILKKDWSITKSVIDMFNQIGISCYTDKDKTLLTLHKYPLVLEAWKVYSTNDDAKSDQNTRMITFLHGRYFDKKYNAVDFFGELCENQNELKDLENYFITKKFKHYNTLINAKTRYAYVM